MWINYFKAAEDELRSLPKLKKSIEILKRKKERIAESGAPSEPVGVDYTKPYVNSAYVNDTLNEILEMQEIERAIARRKKLRK